MIKSLLEPDEKQPGEIKNEREEKTSDNPAIDENFESHFAGIESPPNSDEPENLPEISEPADDKLIFAETPEAFGEKPRATVYTSDPNFDLPENLFDEAADEKKEDELFADFTDDEINFDLLNAESAAETLDEPANFESPAETINETTSAESPVEAKTEKAPFENSGTLFQMPAEPESFAETARKSGLAYAAAITLFGSVVFMLIIGWFADLLFGSSPWGIVGGIILGAAIGFFQFFRMTAQIFKNRDL